MYYFSFLFSGERITGNKQDHEYNSTVKERGEEKAELKYVEDKKKIYRKMGDRVGKKRIEMKSRIGMEDSEGGRVKGKGRVRKEAVEI